jgi:hypothetical protein
MLRLRVERSEELLADSRLSVGHNPDQGIGVLWSRSRPVPRLFSELKRKR